MKFDMSEGLPQRDNVAEQNTPTVGPQLRSQTPPSLTSHMKKAAFFSIDQILGKRDGRIEEEVLAEEYRNLCDDDHDEDINTSDAEDVEKGEIGADGSDKDTGPNSKNDKHTPSYTAIIAQAILSSSEKKLPLGCIYDYIAEHFPQFLKKGQGWRNCVRHNLSLSECFVKAGRARNGRGNYWGIHPRYIKNFSKGDFRKRRASHRPRNRDSGYLAGRFLPQYFHPYVLPPSFPKQHLPAPHRTFTVDNILRSENIDHGSPPSLSSSYKPWLKIAPFDDRMFDDRMEKLPSHSLTYYATSASPVPPSPTQARSYYDNHPRMSPSQKGYGYNGMAMCSCHHPCCLPART